VQVVERKLVPFFRINMGLSFGVRCIVIYPESL
jgi:hypothetical protein